MSGETEKNTSSIECIRAGLKLTIEMLIVEKEPVTIWKDEFG